MNDRTRAFFDTNILVYAYDRRLPNKQKIAQALVRHNLDNGLGVISTQVVQEFCNVTLTKIRNVDGAELKVVIQSVLSAFLAHWPSQDFYLRAIDLYNSASISFYDALIVQAAIDLDCTVLYSEDLQSGQKFGKLTVVNPFK
jgi:predicted nucleic acid-binding protein